MHSDGAIDVQSVLERLCADRAPVNGVYTERGAFAA